VPNVDAVVKVGGSLLEFPTYFTATMSAIDAMRERRILVVPGGGPFAELVRKVDSQYSLGDDTAHWMAVLAMDQYAHLIASRLGRSVLVRTASEIAAAIPDNVPVLEPSCWLREADPLPHSWSVTGDSIAAWVARAIGARRLVLIKAPHAAGDLLVDDHFIDAISTDVTHASVTADRLDLLASALRNDVDAQ
jgi:5-(aminomethyl)-3-furanmethanol phosphate kinase